MSRIRWGSREHVQAVARMGAAAQRKADPFVRVREAGQAATDAIEAMSAALAQGVRTDRVHGGPRPAWAHEGNGERFVARLHRRALDAAVQAEVEASAPPEVVHRRVAGRTVVARRLLARRTNRVQHGDSSVRSKGG